MYLLPLDHISKYQLSTNQNLLNAHARNDCWTCIIPLDMYRLAKNLYSPASKKWVLYWICLVLPAFCGSVIQSLWHSVIIQMRLEYLWGQLANLDQILFEASLGWGKGCIRFWDRLDQNTGFHENRMCPLTYNGENDVSTFSLLFLIRSFSHLQVTRTGIKSRTCSDFVQIRPLLTELGALEHLKDW